MRLTWFGHSAFRVEFGNARILFDPFLTGNPTFKGDAKQVSDGATHVLFTHGHGDHLGDGIEICRRTGAQAVGNAELCDWLYSQGIEKVNPGNHGGTVDCGGFTVSFVNALHSSSFDLSDGTRIYLGNPLGLIVKSEGQPTLYHMGDTDIFSDMALINEIHSPDVGLVPIGDRYTMGGKLAAMACRRFFAFRTIVPCHYGTFPALDQTAEKFLEEMAEDFDKVFVPERGQPFDL
jgi:L-ascorbate metabolism protein UlaG (beta-lactamase superfamily)